MTPWYRKQWIGGLFGRYEAPGSPHQRMAEEIKCLRAGWNDAIAQHDALFKRYRGLSDEMDQLNRQLDKVYSQRDTAIRNHLQLIRSSFHSEMAMWLLGVGMGALATFVVMWALELMWALGL